jgi:DNA-binding transcriptional ArsR family regulator
MKKDISKICYLFFSTLSNPTRLAILELLSEGEKNVTEISEALNQEQSMISHNLRPLERCGFIFSQRKKREHYYSLNKETVDPLFKIFSYHASKYCPTDGKCLTEKHLMRRRKLEATHPLYLSRQ